MDVGVLEASGEGAGPADIDGASGVGDVRHFERSDVVLRACGQCFWAN